MGAGIVDRAVDQGSVSARGVRGMRGSAKKVPFPRPVNQCQFLGRWDMLP